MDKKQKIKKPIGTNKVKNNSKTNHIKKKIPESNYQTICLDLEKV